MNEPSPTLRDLADYIERRMAGKMGSVTLHYAGGKLKKVEVRTVEDARALPRSA